jgi:hypothetical protein
LVIPDSVKTIGKGAFSYCSGLTGDLIIPNSVTSIGDEAFSNCSGLTSVVIPDSVTSIGTYAFFYCSGLTNVTIGSGVKTIGNYAFCRCTELSEITCHAIVAPTISSSTFDIIKEGGILTYPEGSNYSNWLKTSSYYLGYYKWNTIDATVKITYQINQLISPIQLFNKSDCISRMIVDGEHKTISKYYLFDTIGEHVVEYNLSTNELLESTFSGCTNIKKVELYEDIKTIAKGAFSDCFFLEKIVSYTATPPTITNQTFQNVAYYEELFYENGDYNDWMKVDAYYLGYYGWELKRTFTPTRYYDLSITAKNVNGKDTTTIISWSCMCDAVDNFTNKPLTGKTITGTAISDEFPQNTSETETVERVITFEYMGLTASTTIIQGVFKPFNYVIDLNSNWEISTNISNPDSTTYDGVYQSYSNKGIGNSAATMYIDIIGYDNFKLYIRSYAEGNYDYVMVSQLDKAITNNSNYNDTTLIKAHTRASQSSGTTLSSYKLVEFTNIAEGEHRITVLYKKDGTGNNNDDRGYLLIPKDQ